MNPMPTQANLDFLQVEKLEKKHPGEWIVLLKDGTYTHALELSEAMAAVKDRSSVVGMFRSRKPEEPLLY